MCSTSRHRCAEDETKIEVLPNGAPKSMVPVEKILVAALVSTKLKIITPRERRESSSLLVTRGHKDAPNRKLSMENQP